MSGSIVCSGGYGAARAIGGTGGAGGSFLWDGTGGLGGEDDSLLEKDLTQVPKEESQ